MTRLAVSVYILVFVLLTSCGAWADNDLIVDGIREYITGSLSRYDAFVEVEELSVKSNIPPGLDFDGVRVEAPYGVRPGRRVPVTVALLRQGIQVKRLWATVRVRALKDVVVASRPLKIREKIGPGDVKIERVELRDLSSSGVIGSLDEVVGMMVRRPLRAGSYIKRSYLEPETLVRRGESITVVAESRAMQVRTVATALEDGYPGSFIEARTAGGKSLFGLVTENGELLVRF